ncbi:MAG: DUF1345 domain-containing protein [Acidimicrobiia bacterium]|nr:DUF1345 domain-containing protein [Acidimicrobiia bacterium]
MERLRATSALPRAIVALALGGIVAASLSPFVAWQLAVVTGWDVAAVVLLAWIWLVVGRLDAHRTRAVATREDDSRVAVEVLLLSAAVISLAGVGSTIVKADQTTGATHVELLVASVLTVVLSWALVHSLFTLRYARLYYTDPVGGVDFHSAEPPDYQDFAYLAFTVGMAFAVSDTEIGDRSVRRTILHHALISYLFGVVIIAVLVNIVANVI